MLTQSDIKLEKKNPHLDPTKFEPTLLQNLRTSAVAAFCQIVFGHFLWVLQMRKLNGHAGKSIFEIKGLARGMPANMAATVPLNTFNILLCAVFYNYCFEKFQHNQELHRGLSAISAAFVSSFIASPLELFRAMQLKNKLSLFTTALNFINQHGLRSIGIGSMGHAGREIIYNYGFFGAAPLIDRKIKSQGFESDLTMMVSGPIAGITSSVVSQPLDTIKIRQQSLADKEQISFIKAIKKIHNQDGCFGFFKGGFFRGARVTAGITIISAIREEGRKYDIEQNYRQTVQRIR